jgi:hypothetical protein
MEEKEMSIIKKPYELSVWRDEWSSESFDEQRLVVIGSDKMLSQNRAVELKLKENTNGSNELSFKLYYTYEDHITGEKVSNPFVDYLTNESKLKLNYDGKWYDFIVKDIVENSTDKSYSYTAQDQYIVELSKNGYDVVLDAQASSFNDRKTVYGNIGTADELVKRVIPTGEWEVVSEIIPQKTSEALLPLTVTQTFDAYLLKDETSVAPEADTKSTSIAAGAIIYAFFSCCRNKPYRFQFIYLPDGNYETNQDGIISNKNCQYFIDGPGDNWQY